MKFCFSFAKDKGGALFLKVCLRDDKPTSYPNKHLKTTNTMGTEPQISTPVMKKTVAGHDTEPVPSSQLIPLNVIRIFFLVYQICLS